MKESLYHPHFLDLDSRMKSFDGNVPKSFISTPPSYMTEEILGFKLILDAHTMTNRIADYKKGSFLDI